jgi:hypothetical protein
MSVATHAALTTLPGQPRVHLSLTARDVPRRVDLRRQVTPAPTGIDFWSVPWG